MLNLPKVNSIHDLSYQTGLSGGLIYKLSNISDKYYRIVKIPKKSGGQRKLACPSREMKAIQAWILRYILDKIPVHPSATAFRLETNLSANVVPHINRPYFLCCDLVDFFGSLSKDAVYKVFRSLGYKPEISHTFSNICCFRDSLPQGGVTSPALSNLICLRLDGRIASYCGRRNIKYTRYADDMTFSAVEPKSLVRIKPTIEKIVGDYGLKLNESKTRFLGPRQCRRITGLVISGDTYGIGKKQKRILRARIYNFEHRQHMNEDEYNFHLNHLKGWMSFLKDVDRIGYEQLTNYWERLKKQKS